MNDAPPLFSRPWLWSFLPVYFVHLLDERLTGAGTAQWAQDHLDVYLTNEAWLLINAVWFVGFTIAIALTNRGVVPQWFGVSLAVHLVLHSLGRVGGSALFLAWAPGIASGVLVCLPWAATILWRGYHGLSRRELTIGVVVGILSLQPLWDFAMLPVLSPRPTGL